MTTLLFLPSARACSRALLAVLAAVALAAPAQAERTDRLQKIRIDADQDGAIDLQKQVVTYNGNVVISQGTMLIRAARVEVHQLPSGYYNAVAFGAPDKPATFRQKRDGVDEYIEGSAARLEYDGKAALVKLIDRAEARHLRGATTADEISGNLITYDATTEKLTVTGGAKPTAANPNGRVSTVLSPREGSEAATESAAGAALAASAPLKTSPALGTPASSPAKGGKR
ncbi:MAG TPA: lipopolysaccharide transport periplasmic protein LptA [Burkholderiaceae bacterium]|nr:lipopolysaccharide transport periplasmic protein LptA [Burkholderiaceae bacterium]